MEPIPGPTLEGGFYAFLIAYYDSTFRPRNTGFSWLLGQAGKFSYSIHLLHFFTYYHLARLVDRHVVDLTSIYVAIPISALAFAAMIPLGYLSFRFVEAPFLELRRPYTRPERPERRESGLMPGVAANASIASDARM